MLTAPSSRSSCPRSSPVFFALAACLVLLTGCPSEDVNQVITPDISVSHASADAASARLDVALTTGTPGPQALAALVAELLQDPSVAAAMVNEAGDTAWVIYHPGLQVSYDIIDLPAGFQLPTEGSEAPTGGEEEFPAAALQRPALPGNAPLISAQAASPFLPAMPGNHRAVVASSIAACTAPGLNSGFSSLPLAAKWRLERLGYATFSTPASLEFFESISRRQCSVVFIDARGWMSTTDEYFIALTAPGLGASAVTGSNQILMTSTPATEALRTRYRDDLINARLKVRYPKYRQDGQLVSCGAFFGVTANFVRAHDPGRWPDRTMLVLNAGHMIASQEAGSTSEWFALLKEKSTDPLMIGWTAGFDYPTAAAAMANLFELMSGADFRYALRSTEDNTILEPQSVQPPMNLLDAISAVTTLWGNRSGGVVDVANNSAILPLWDGVGLYNGFVLAPKVQDFWLDRYGNAALSAQALDNAELRIATGEGVVGLQSLNIGTFNMLFTLEGLSGAFSGWQVNPPLGAAGPMSLWLPDGRHGPALTLFTWKPTLKVTGTGPHGLTYTKNYQMVCRALVAPRTRGLLDPTSAWSGPSSDDFSAQFDSGGCVVTWSVSGSETVDNMRYSYSGGGSRTMTFRPTGDGSLASVAGGGQAADLAVNPEEGLQLQYIETIANLNTGDQTSSTLSLPTGIGLVQGIGLDAALGLVAGSQALDAPQDGWGETLTWSATPSSPAFNATTERR